MMSEAEKLLDHMMLLVMDLYLDLKTGWGKVFIQDQQLPMLQASFLQDTDDVLRKGKVQRNLELVLLQESPEWEWMQDQTGLKIYPENQREIKHK